MIKDLLRFFFFFLISMANYLEISADNMRSIHSGRRSFKAQHIMWLQALKAALQLNVPSNELPDVVLDKTLLQKEFVQPLQKNINHQVKLIAGKEHKLENYRSEYKDLQRGLCACQTLLKGRLPYPHHQKWLNLRERHLSQKLVELQLKIALHEAQISGLQIQIEDLEKAVNANQWLK